ncbi:MAG: Wzz/FepE/Etk N-terminal domain-containing protein [Rubrobacter sp.]
MTSTSGQGWQGGQRDDPSLAEVLHVLRGRRLLVIGAVLVLAGTTLLFGLFREPVYTAEATVSVTPGGELNDEEAQEVFMQEIQGAVVTREMLREARSRAGWETGSEAFSKQLDPQSFATQEGGLGMLVRFSGAEPDQAARAANAYAEVFVEGVERLDEERLAGGTLAAEARVEQRAVPGWSSPRPLIYAAAAAGAGLLLGGAAALLLEGRASGWRGVRDAELTLRAPVLGTIPDYSRTEVGG